MTEKDASSAVQARKDGGDNEIVATRIPISVDLVEPPPIVAQAGFSPKRPLPITKPFTLAVTVSAGPTTERVSILRVKSHNNVNPPPPPDPNAPPEPNKQPEPEERNFPTNSEFFKAGTVLEKDVAPSPNDTVATFDLEISAAAAANEAFFPDPGIYDLLFVIRVGKSEGAGKAKSRRFGLVRVEK